MKRILILTAGFGEGHNSAARGVRAGLARVAPTVEVELRDLFPETFGLFNEITRRAYLALINRSPKSWGYVYKWLDRKKDFDARFQKFRGLKKNFGRLLDRFQPDVVVSTFPPYPYFLQQILGADRRCRNIAIVTDSITVNAIWYHAPADYFVVANEQSADVVRAAGVPPEKIKVLGFPISPRFADFPKDRQSPAATAPRVLYVINAGTRRAPDLVRKLLQLNIQLTVTVGRDEKLRRAIESAAGERKIDIYGWTEEMPRLLCESHVLIGKAGGATVQETIAAACPMIVNHVVSGQEEGNARLIAETNSGTIALSNDEVVAQVERAFANDAEQWREWFANISKLSRPRASLDIAEFLLSI
ncbi:MAG TPA: glycosyltransferase [Chthoniobacterales bacterium]|jgi:processive 1,2-diacylglycerol beta-glucosyltransferase|nr:glycosyltransferase [Chthoniobacterales bacterium]